MPKFTLQRQKEINAIYEADSAASSKFKTLLEAFTAQKKANGDTSPVTPEELAKLRTQAGLGSAPAICEVGAAGQCSSSATSEKYSPPSGQKPIVSGPTSVKANTSQTHYIRYMGPRTRFCVEIVAAPGSASSVNTGRCSSDANYTQLGTGESSGFSYVGSSGTYEPTWSRTKVLGTGVAPGTRRIWYFKDPDTGMGTSFNIEITQ